MKRFTILFLTLSISIFAISERFNHLNEDYGLKSRRCFSIKQDKNGFIWIATKLSIDRYDGHEFVHYKLTDPVGKEFNKISRNFLQLSPDSTLWAFNDFGYLYKYDDQTDSFQFVYSTGNHYKSDALINSIFFENENIIYLATLQGILRLDLVKNSIYECSIVNNYNVNHVTKENELYYLSTSAGLFVVKDLDKSDAKIINTFLANDFINFVYFDEKYREFWIATFSNGIYILPESMNDNIQHALLDVKKPVRTIIPYGKDSYALGVDGSGILIVDRRSKEVTNTFIHDQKESYSISSNSVYDLMLDKKNILWVAMYHSGISYSDRSHLQFYNFCHISDNTNSIMANHINYVFEDSDNDLWFGTNGGLSVFYSKTSTWKHFFKGSTISTIAEYPQNKIWVGGYAFGIAEVDKKTENIRQYKFNSLSIIDTDNIYSIYTDKDSKNIWAGGLYGKISCFDPYNLQSRKTEEHSVRSLVPYNDSILLIASDGMGIYKLNKNSGKTHPFLLSYHSINSILKEDDNSLWIATRENGLYYYDAKTNLLTNYTESDGLSSDHIYSLEKDNKENLWLSTEYGLNKFNPSTGEVIRFTKRDGLISNQFLPNSSQRCSNGNLLYGSVDGAVMFNPNEIEKQEVSYSYPLTFTDFSVLGERVLPQTSKYLLKNTIDKTTSIILPHNKNYFSLTFTMPNYLSSNETEYSCFLEGYDLEWTKLSTNNKIAYSKLSPGVYKFHVRAYIDRNVLEERNITITIKQPWWNTSGAWFTYILVVILISGFYLKIYLPLRYYDERQRKKQTEEKIDFFINTAHDILTPLNLIEAPLKDISILQNLTTEAGYLLSLAIENCQKLSHFVHQLIDFQRISLNSEQLVVTLNNLQVFFMYKKHSYQTIASQKFISLNLHVTHTEDNIYFDKVKVNRIIDNLLSNAIKYTPFGGTIDIRAYLSDNSWSFSVRDTGPGISPKNKRLIFKHIFREDNSTNSEIVGSGIGLKMAHTLVQIHQGKIHFNSKEGTGSEFIVTLPLKYDSEYIEEDINYSHAIENLSSEKDDAQKDVLLFIIDSNAEMSNYLKSTFSRSYNVNVYHSGADALLHLSRTTPDLIIVSSILSDMVGVDFCQKIKENTDTEHIPLVMILGLVEADLIKSMLSIGVIDYVQKPFDSELLELKVSNLLSFERSAQNRALSSIRKSNVTKVNEQKDQEFMENLIGFIEKNLDNPELNNTMLCKEFALSRTLLYHRITQLTSNSPMEFIQIIRLKNAANLLLSGQHTVIEVSHMVGIENPKYFSRIFKKYYNVSPKDYGK